MLVRMLLALRVQCRGRQRAEVRSGHGEVWNLEARIVRCHGWGDQWGEALASCQSQSWGRGNSPTYRIVLAHVISLVEESLLRVHLAHVAVRVAVHLDAVGRGRYAIVRAEDVVLGLKCWSTGLAELAQRIVKGEVIRRVAAHAALRLLPAARAIVVMLGKLGHLGGEVMESAGNIGERCGAIIVEFREVEIQVVEINKVTKVLLGRVHITKWLRRRPCLPVHLGDA